MRPRALLACVLALADIALVAPGGASGHPERPTAFPDPTRGAVPVYRSRGPSTVVCKPDSRARLKRIFRADRRLLRKRLAILRRCRFRHIQAAIDASRSGYRILIMPGTYREEPSRAVPVGGFHQPPCPDDYTETEGFSTQGLPPPVGPRSNDPPVRPDRNYTINCPNSKNLIAVVSDPRPEQDPQHPTPPQCLQLCNLQIEGLGARPTDVLIVGDRRKPDVIRIDRSTGVYLRNFAVEQAEFNDIDLIEVNGFRISRIVARYAKDYGVLSFTSDHGLYDHVETYGNGDSGVYPGSAAKGCDVPAGTAYATCEQQGCRRYTTELRFVDSHDNVLGYSGTAGNSTWVHDSRFHHNGTGMATDSFASGHPGMPQECAKWEHNRIYSNNRNDFTAERQASCRRVPFEQRPREMVCPQFQVAVGTGIGILGGNRNLVRGNFIYDNWRYGIAMAWSAAASRGDNDPAHQFDTSNGNRFLDNKLGVGPEGTRDRNGLDVWWDEEGAGNCWEANVFASGPGRRSDPATLATCAHPRGFAPSNALKYATLVTPCFAWDPSTNPRPLLCPWFDTPPDPR